MSTFGDVTGAIKLIVDVFNAFRGVNKDKADTFKNLFYPSIIERLHLIFQPNVTKAGFAPATCFFEFHPVESDRDTWLS